MAMTSQQAAQSAMARTGKKMAKIATAEFTDEEKRALGITPAPTRALGEQFKKAGFKGELERTRIQEAAQKGLIERKREPTTFVGEKREPPTPPVAPTPVLPPVAPPVVPPPTVPVAPTFGPSTYTGVSIVDYLKSVNQPSDFASRAKLAEQQGITNYTGTATQNTQLLGLLRKEVTPAVAPPPEAPPPPGVPPEVPPEAPPPPEIPPEAPPEVAITDVERDLMDKYGYTPEQIKDPAFISSQISRITGEIGALEVGVEREAKIKELVELSASLGLAYPEEYIKIMTAPGETEAEIREKIYEETGIPDLEEKFRARPEQTFEEIYSSAYSDLKLGELKSEIDALRAKIADREEKRDKVISDINENPWLSEASRVGRAKRAWDMAERELTRITNQLTLADNMYTRGKEEAENVATRALNEFVREREWTKEELNYYIKRAEADIEAKVKAAEREEVKERFRYYPEYLEAVAVGKEAEEARKAAEEIEKVGTKAEKEIVSAVRGSMTAYRLNPAGFRERLIENLVGRYGEESRSFIGNQVYQYLPDILPKEETTKTEEADLYDSL